MEAAGIEGLLEDNENITRFAHLALILLKSHGFSIPPQLTVGTVLDALPRPWWWFDFLTTQKLEFASLSATGGTVGDLLDLAMDPTISFEDLKVIRDMWPGKLVIKGVQNVEDSKMLADFGVDGILLSNHGGRQLDRAPIPFHLLPEVVREVGKDTEVMVDTGIMNGADIVASIALGAKFTLVGRAYLYGLMAGGSDEHIALAMPIFDALRPEVPREEGFAHAGPVGAGHFAKMVHNGVEYGLMQAYAEGFELMQASKLITDVPGVIQAWSRGTVVRSWLLDLLASWLPPKEPVIDPDRPPGDVGD